MLEFFIRIVFGEVFVGEEEVVLNLMGLDRIFMWNDYIDNVNYLEKVRVKVI